MPLDVTWSNRALGKEKKRDYYRKLKTVSVSKCKFLEILLVLIY